MGQRQSVRELTPLTRALLGVTTNGLWCLAAVTEDGSITLPGTLVLDTDRGFVTLCYAQEGLTSRGPSRKDEIRWETEPDLTMGRTGDAEEWLDLVPLEDGSTVPSLPLRIHSVTGWFGIGSYTDVLAVILSGGGCSLVVMTTYDFGLRCVTEQEARDRAELLAKNMNLRLVEQEQRL